ncbi:hypothetical protein CHS0354_007071 [Potamilus streckersoni]|uniref:Uncharacterized protein n=1 Tax=Potamilus streckersoni TaxID=2493646 RepID=A0AAE0RY97_9BIVA|nr:hypothetical protein CHS0354_007071 [Potamilus streckersoni]
MEILFMVYTKRLPFKRLPDNTSRIFKLQKKKKIRDTNFSGMKNLRRDNYFTKYSICMKQKYSPLYKNYKTLREQSSLDTSTPNKLVMNTLHTYVKFQEIISVLQV